MGGGLALLALALPANAHLWPAGEEPLVEAVLEFERNCFQCHGETAAKGGLRLHVAQGWLAQVDVDDVEASELLYRLTVDADEADAMPPEGPRLSKGSIAAITKWIESGAEEDALMDAIELASSLMSRRKAAAEAVATSSGARIDVLELDGQFAGYSVSWSHRPSPPSPAGFVALGPIAEDVVELSLAGTAFEEAWLARLPAFKRLVALDLSRTSVGDAGLLHFVATSPAMVRVNLTSTAVTAEGLAAAAKTIQGLVLEHFDTPAAKEPTDPFASIAGHHPRRILAGDASRRRVALLSEVVIGSPKRLWERPVEHLHDLQWLGESPHGGGHGRVLVQESWTRIVEVDTATNGVLWSYDAGPQGDESVEIHSFRRLADGSTMVAESGRGRVVFVDGQGSVSSSFPLTLDAPDPHHDTRLVRPTPGGTFLVAHERDGVIREYDRSGQVVWTFDVPLFGEGPRAGHGFDAHGDQAFCALRLPGGDTLVTTGNGHGLLRVTPNGEVAQRIQQDSIDGVRLAWTTTVQSLSSGRVILGNCHAGPDQPQAIELDLETLDVHWQFRDFQLFGNGLASIEIVERTPSGR